MFTDNADLEAMLLLSPALERTLAEWATATKLARVGGADDLRRRAWSVLIPVSRLRRANALRGTGLAFDKVRLRETITRASLELRIVGYLDRLARASDRPRRELEVLCAETLPPICPVTSELLVRGRDVAVVIEVALTQIIGDLQQQQAEGLVEPCLRLAASAGDLDGLPFAQRVADGLAAAA